MGLGMVRGVCGSTVLYSHRRSQTAAADQSVSGLRALLVETAGAVVARWSKQMVEQDDGWKRGRCDEAAALQIGERGRR